MNLNKIKNNYKCIINTTNGFAKGFNLNEYYKLMQDSKIALVPNGAVIPESFRYFEAFESNCIVITTYPVYDDRYNHWYYDNNPAIILNNWNQLNKELLNKLLKKEQLEQYEILNKEYFDRCVSSKGVANFMINIIRNKN